MTARDPFSDWARDRGAHPSHHWGVASEELLYDNERHPNYARAHHLAGHHWALRRLSARLGPAGWSLALPHLGSRVGPEVEASAVLVEALASEYLRSLYRFADFGIAVSDVDWDRVRYDTGDCWREARARGCFRYAVLAARRLGDPSWFERAGAMVVEDWSEIASLAGCLGRGQVLEPDEVEQHLRWW